LILLPQRVLAFGVGAAMADIFVAALIDALDNVGIKLQRVRIHIVRAGHAIFVEKVEIIPDADPVSVVAPGEIALVLRRRAGGAVRAETGAEGEGLDIVAKRESEPLAARP